MLRDLFLNAFLFCGIVTSIALMAVILKASYRYLFVQPKPMTASMRSVIEAWDEMQKWKLLEGEQQAPVRVAPLKRSDLPPAQTDDLILIEKVVTEWKAKPTPKSQPEPEIIECGNCGKEIKSPKIDIMRDPGSLTVKAIYQCEHCGVKVAV